MSFGIKLFKAFQKAGYFVGNFFGLKDSWATIKKEMPFLSKEQVEKNRQKHKERKTSEETIDVFDYDWFEEDEE